MRRTRKLLGLVIALLCCVDPSEEFIIAGSAAVSPLGRPWHDQRACRGRLPAVTTGLRLAMRDGDSLVDKGLDLLRGVKLDGVQADEMAEPLGDEPPFCVVVLDDDDHTVDEVVQILRQATGTSWKLSLDNTLRIGRSGKAVVYRGSAVACEQVKRRLAAQTLKASVEASSPDNSAEAELEREAQTGQNGAKLVEEEQRWGERVFRSQGQRPKVVFIGGTGRVGSWTIRELVRLTKGDVDLVIAGRQSKAADMLMKQLRGDTFIFGGREWSTMRTVLKGSADFERVDLSDDASLERVMQGADLVVHTAGPFQRGEPNVLRAAIATQTPYMDVCDDLDYAQQVKSLDAAVRCAQDLDPKP